MERHRQIADELELHSVELRPSGPIVLVGLELDQILRVIDRGDLERPVADLVGRILEPRLAALVDQILLRRVDHPQRREGVKVGRRLAQLELDRLLIHSRDAELLEQLGHLGLVGRDGRVEDRIGAFDHKEGALVIADGAARVERAIDRLDEVLGRER